MLFRFRIKIYTPLLADAKALVGCIKAAHKQSGGMWLYIREIETGDKRANFGLLLHGKFNNFLVYCRKITLHFSEMCETYTALPDVDRFEIPCAPNLGKPFYLSLVNIFLICRLLQE